LTTFTKCSVATRMISEQNVASIHSETFWICQRKRLKGRCSWYFPSIENCAPGCFREIPLSSRI
jgi:hypothetical protein